MTLWAGEVNLTAWDTASGFFSRSETLCTVYKNSSREPVCDITAAWLAIALSQCYSVWVQWSSVSWPQAMASLSSLSHFYIDAAHTYTHKHTHTCFTDTHTSYTLQYHIKSMFVPTFVLFTFTSRAVVTARPPTLITICIMGDVVGRNCISENPRMWKVTERAEP